ncbi:hypothetical protein PYW07_015079 [Mythimna separata]|uniref:Elongation of very long chain fatty acids protein n=1 Tax=Mythimna separata TaxID=271217 RepID=A0AAD8DY59_MYTSE|nr:hypothetical protein PYW07_015079 [Mythimna separata]
MEVINGIVMDRKNGTQELPTSFYENTDFVNTWYLMGSPLPVTLILASYLLFVLKIGPALMKNREPLKLQNVIQFYNAIQVVVSCFLLYVCVRMMAENGLLPKTCVMETEYNRRSLTAAMYYYLVAKLSELLDTIFFVLRKKYNQVSFLHVYHHTLMVVVTWTALKYEPTYALLFLGMLNSFVHVIMYTYYGLSSIPSLTKYLWWKKYITSMQLIQFVLILTHFLVACVTSDCKPSYIMIVSMSVNVFLFLYLFGSFYIKTYNKTASAKAEHNKQIKMNNEAKNNLYEMDKKLYQNGKNDKIDDDKDYTTASITVNDTYRIRFNMKTNKLAKN